MQISFDCVFFPKILWLHDKNKMYAKSAVMSIAWKYHYLQFDGCTKAREKQQNSC